MNTADKFDAFTRQLATPRTRRSVIATALGLGLGSTLLGRSRAFAEDGNGICEMKKTQIAFYIYNEDEDDVGYDTSLPKQDPWEIKIGDQPTIKHTEVYLSVGLPTISVVTTPDESARTVWAYGSQWYGEEEDCKLFDIVKDANDYARIRAKKGHSGVVVNLATGKVQLIISDPDNRIYKVAREDVPGLLSTFNNAKDGEANLFDGVDLIWADTGEAISLSSPLGGGIEDSGNCQAASATRVEDAVSIAGEAPDMAGNPDAYRIVDAWSNQHNPNLKPSENPNSTKAQREYGTYYMLLSPGEDLSELLGLNGAVWEWPGDCGSQAVADFMSKPDWQRIDRAQYLAWVQDAEAWPTGGAIA